MAYDLMEEIMGSTAAALSVTAAHAQKVTDKPSLLPATSQSSDEDEEPAPEASVQAATSQPTKKRRGDQPPKWFEQFAQQMQEDTKRRHEETMEQMKRLEHAQSERTDVMREMRDILKSAFEKQS